MKTKINLLTLAFLLISPFFPVRPLAVLVQLERVIDGDTIVVRSGGVLHTVRISLIDAPELAQTCQSKNGIIQVGEESKKALSGLLPPYFLLETSGKDMYGRVLAKVPVALQLVESGWSLPYQRAYFSSLAEKRLYYSAFYHAYHSGRGMWSCQKLMNPLFYRKKFKSKLK